MPPILQSMQTETKWCGSSNALDSHGHATRQFELGISEHRSQSHAQVQGGLRVSVCVCDRVDQVFGLHRQLERDRVNFCRSKTYRPTLCRACCGSQCGSHLCRDVFSTPRRHHVGCKPHTALNPKPNVHTQCDPPPSRLHNEQLSWPDPSGQQQGFQTAAKQLDAATDVRRL